MRHDEPMTDLTDRGRNREAVAGSGGPATGGTRLDAPVLVARLLALLDSAAHLAGQVPAAALSQELPRRGRTTIELAYHVPQVVVAFLDAALGGRLTLQHFERKPPGHFQAAADVARLTRSVSQALAVWWGANQSRLPAMLDTDDGLRSLPAVLEQTTAHVAQHVRQLEQLLVLRGLEPDRRLPRELLAGLPLPEDIWDAEVPLT